MSRWILTFSYHPPDPGHCTFDEVLDDEQKRLVEKAFVQGEGYHAREWTDRVDHDDLSRVRECMVYGCENLSDQGHGHALGEHWICGPCMHILVEPTCTAIDLVNFLRRLAKRRPAE